VQFFTAKVQKKSKLLDESKRINLERGCLKRLSLRAKRSGDPQSPENQRLVFHGMAGQARHDKLLTPSSKFYGFK